jgi:hypothetical protein
MLYSTITGFKVCLSSNSLVHQININWRLALHRENRAMLDERYSQDVRTPLKWTIPPEKRYKPTNSLIGKRYMTMKSYRIDLVDMLSVVNAISVSMNDPRVGPELRSDLKEMQEKLKHMFKDGEHNTVVRFDEEEEEVENKTKKTRKKKCK